MSQAKKPLKPGQVVAGKYEIKDELSSGAFAVVYDAYRMEDRVPMAIKALRLNVTTSDPAAIERFVREAAIACHLQHPNLVRIHDFGRTRNDVMYMVMERLHGQLLSGIIHEQPMSPGRVRNILRQMLDALTVAHGQGLVHRDLKPSNIFLCKVDQAHDTHPVDWVKILDFGFAKGIDLEDGVPRTGEAMRATLTIDGARVGTPGYMAPELLEEDRELTPQADLYGVGVLGHEMLTGEPAFPGQGLERALAQRHSDPQEPSPTLSGHPLYDVIRKLIKRDLSERYSSAEAALKDINALGRPQGKLWM